MLDCIIDRTNQYIDMMPKKERKKYGQFFTSKDTARFMADLYQIPAEKQKIKHFGCGSRLRDIVMCIFRKIGTDRICTGNRIDLL